MSYSKEFYNMLFNSPNYKALYLKQLLFKIVDDLPSLLSKKNENVSENTNATDDIDYEKNIYIKSIGALCSLIQDYLIYLFLIEEINVENDNRGINNTIYNNKKYKSLKDKFNSGNHNNYKVINNDKKAHELNPLPNSYNFEYLNLLNTVIETKNTTTNEMIKKNCKEIIVDYFSNPSKSRQKGNNSDSLIDERNQKIENDSLLYYQLRRNVGKTINRIIKDALDSSSSNSYCDNKNYYDIIYLLQRLLEQQYSTEWYKTIEEKIKNKLSLSSNEYIDKSERENNRNISLKSELTWYLPFEDIRNDDDACEKRRKEMIGKLQKKFKNIAMNEPIFLPIVMDGLTGLGVFLVLNLTSPLTSMKTMSHQNYQISRFPFMYKTIGIDDECKKIESFFKKDNIDYILLANGSSSFNECYNATFTDYKKILEVYSDYEEIVTDSEKTSTESRQEKVIEVKTKTVHHKVNENNKNSILNEVNKRNDDLINIRKNATVKGKRKGEYI